MYGHHIRDIMRSTIRANGISLFRLHSYTCYIFLAPGPGIVTIHQYRRVGTFRSPKV